MRSIARFNALVPMKGHSERVPNKNIRDFCGKPLYHHIVEALLASPYVSGVFINTDSKVIANDVLTNFHLRVKVIERPSHLCGDFVYFNEIIKYDLSQIEGEYFLQTHSTSPLLQTSTINKAIDRFLERGDHDSLFGVSRVRARLYDKDGKALNHDPEDKLLRTQDLPPIYEENSTIYLFTREAFFKRENRIGTKPILFEIPKMEGVDIDTEEDFVFAEKLYQCL